jgi:cell division protein FtsL
VGNVAEKIYKKQQEQPQVTTQTVTRRIRITPGEKLLASLLLCGVVIGSVFLISNNATLYEVNGDIAEIEVTIKDKEKTNKELHMTIEELTKHESLTEVGKKQGLSFDANNIKPIE